MHTTYIHGICINTVIMDLKSARVKGCVSKNEYASYTIFLNSVFSFNQLRKTYLHEVDHIINGDFSKDNADEIECFAHM